MPGAAIAAIPAIIAAIGGAIQVGKSVAGNKQTRYNKKQAKRLEKLQEAGQLGLSPEEERLADLRLNDPVRQASTQLLDRTSAAQAATGQTATADLARAQREGLELVAGGAARAGTAKLEADLATTSRQRQELEDRLAAQAAASEERSADAFEGLGQVASQVGALAGAPPETTRMYGQFGTKVRDFSKFRSMLADQGFDDESIEALVRMERASPGVLAQALARRGGG